jgi:hypothetical protein
MRLLLFGMKIWCYTYHMSRFVHGIFYFILVCIIGLLSYKVFTMKSVGVAGGAIPKESVSDKATSTGGITLPEDSRHPEQVVTVTNVLIEKLPAPSQQVKISFKSQWHSYQAAIAVVDTQKQPSESQSDSSNIHQLDYYLDCSSGSFSACPPGSWKRLYSRDLDFTRVSDITYIPIANNSLVNGNHVTFIEGEVSGECCDDSSAIVNRLIDYDSATQVTTVRYIGSYDK